MAVRILVAEDTGGGGRWRWDDLHLLSLSMRGYRRWRMLVVEGTGGGGRWSWDDACTCYLYLLLLGLKLHLCSIHLSFMHCDA